MSAQSFDSVINQIPSKQFAIGLEPKRYQATFNNFNKMIYHKSSTKIPPLSSSTANEWLNLTKARLRAAGLGIYVLGKDPFKPKEGDLQDDDLQRMDQAVGIIQESLGREYAWLGDQWERTQTARLDPHALFTYIKKHMETLVSKRETELKQEAADLKTESPKEAYETILKLSHELSTLNTNLSMTEEEKLDHFLKSLEDSSYAQTVAAIRAFENTTWTKATQALLKAEQRATHKRRLLEAERQTTHKRHLQAHNTELKRPRHEGRRHDDYQLDPNTPHAPAPPPPQLAQQYQTPPPAQLACTGCGRHHKGICKFRNDICDSCGIKGHRKFHPICRNHQRISRKQNRSPLTANTNTCQLCGGNHSATHCTRYNITQRESQPTQRATPTAMTVTAENAGQPNNAWSIDVPNPDTEPKADTPNNRGPTGTHTPPNMPSKHATPTAKPQAHSMNAHSTILDSQSPPSRRTTHSPTSSRTPSRTPSHTSTTPSPETYSPYAAATGPSPPVWTNLIIDSYSNTNLINQEFVHLLINRKPTTDIITGIGPTPIKATERGTLKLWVKIPHTNQYQTLYISDTLYAPSSPKNLISFSTFDRTCETTTNNGEWVFVAKSNHKPLLTAIRDQDGWYHIQLKQSTLRGRQAHPTSTSMGHKQAENNPPTPQNQKDIKSEQKQSPQPKTKPNKGSPATLATEQKQSPQPKTKPNKGSPATLATWHARMAHINLKQITRAFKQGAFNHPNCTALLTHSGEKHHCMCEGCEKGKKKWHPPLFFREKQLTQPGGRLHSDILVLTTTTKGGAKYLLSFIDDTSSWAKVYLINSRHDLHEYFTEVRSWYKTQFRTDVRYLRSDNEYVTKAFESLQNKDGWELEPCPPYQKNYTPIAENFNRVIMGLARAMLHSTDLPDSWIGEALLTAVYVRNRCLVDGNNRTPYEKLYGTKPRVHYLRPFGALAYAKTPLPDNKVAPRAERCMLLGYDDKQHTYRVLSLERRNTILHSASVSFDESNCTSWHTRDWIQHTPNKRKAPSTPHDIAGRLDPITHQGDTTSTLSEAHESDPQDDDSRYPKRARKSVVTPFHVTHNASVSGQHETTPPAPHVALPHDTVQPTPTTKADTAPLTALPYEPDNYEDARTCEDRQEWEKEMREQLAALHSHGTFELVPLPKGRKALQPMWVYKVKTKHGQFDRRKARLVVCGNRAKPGVDYLHTSSPVVGPDTTRLLIAEAFLRGKHIHLMDINDAYLNGPIDAEVYMRQPKGFEDQSKPYHVLRLLKGLYGLKQSGRIWHKKLVTELKAQGYTQTYSDSCVFVGPDGTLLLVYVDDIVVIADTLNQATKAKERISKVFKARDLGDISEFLGVHFERSEHTLKMHQRAYAENTLKRFGMLNAKPAATPMEANPSFLPTSPDNPVTDFPYRSALGCLGYLAMWTRPDLTEAYSVLAQFQEAPNASHVAALKRALRYLAGTLDRGITFHRHQTGSFYAVCDASFATETRARSRTGYALITGGAAFCWKSRSQKYTTVSAAEAEYVAACECAQRVAWARNLLRECGWAVAAPTLMQLDNQQAVRMGLERDSRQRTLHLSVRTHYLLDRTESGDITIEWVPTNDNPADMLTKPLQGLKFQLFTDLLMGYLPSRGQRHLSKPLVF